MDTDDTPQDPRIIVPDVVVNLVGRLTIENEILRKQLEG